jgi:HSP20 family protein
MSLLKFRKRPFGNLIFRDFFDMDDFFDNRSWVREMLPSDSGMEKRQSLL